MNKQASTVFKAISILATLVISGCTGYAPSKEFIGLSRAETVLLLGQPTPTPANLDSARRLDFPRGPFGKHTYSVYFDERGTVSGFRQLLTAENFAKIAPGMAESEVVETIGVSRDSVALGRDVGYVWSYRYDTPLCRRFQVEFTPESKVRSAGYTVPEECKVGGRAIR